MLGSTTDLRSMEDTISGHFSHLSSRGKILAEHIWIGGSGSDIRSKTTVLDRRPLSVDELPAIKFDGTFTDQAFGHRSTVYAKPVSIAADPFRGGDHVLVFCETYAPPQEGAASPDIMPHPTNNRAPCMTVMQQAADQEPYFSVEQQYTLMDGATNWPLGWPERASAGPTPSSYCSIGEGHNFGREFSEAHLQACIHAGIPIRGCQAEAVRGQWSYKIGPCPAIELSDHLWMSRYILLRCSEKYKVKASFDAKPVPGDWNGNGAFVKYSTAMTRDRSNVRSAQKAYQGYMEIQRHLKCLEQAHIRHLVLYGSGNALRMSSVSYPKPYLPFAFTADFGTKNVSVRISDCATYYEDRRPAANMDPYVVTMLLVCTTLGIPIPNAPEQLMEQYEDNHDSQSSSGGSSAILSELDKQDSIFGPDTPPQHPSLLDSECSSC